MKLTFKEAHDSIEKFNPIELPNFTILTGLNGSGKSHLLQAIKAGKCIVDEIAVSEITYFDYRTFFAQDEQPANNNEIAQARQTAWGHITSAQSNLGNISLVNQFTNFKSTFGIDYSEVLELSGGKPLFEITNDDLKGNTTLISKLNAYKQQVMAMFNHQNFKGQPLVSALLSLVKRSPKIPIDLTKEEFESLFQPINFKSDFLPTELSKVFLDYKFRQFEELVIKKVEKEQFGTEVKYKTKEEFKSDFGTEPWILIEDILKKFESLDFEINNPEDMKFSYPYNHTFTTQITHRIKKIPILFSKLSSGEKILFALVLSLYNSKKDKLFPKLLLLDEVDASLHPSMIKNLISVIKDTLAQEHGVKVIMVTHSPSTIASAHEEDIYIVNKDGLNKIEKQTRREALRILSSGFGAITLEESEIGMSYNLSKSNLPVLFTEGITDKIILETAWSILFPGVEQPFYIQDFFDANSLGNLLGRADQAPDGIFHTYRNRIFISLFDFDNAGYNQWNSLRKKFKINSETDVSKCLTIKHDSFKAYSILLPVPDNELKTQVIKEDGINTYEGNSKLQIEHLFFKVPELSEYFDTENVPGGQIIVFKESKKREFAESLKNHNKEIFSNCIPIFNKIKEIISAR